MIIRRPALLQDISNHKPQAAKNGKSLEIVAVLGTVGPGPIKLIHGLAPQYVCDLFTEKSKLNSRNLRNTSTDLRLPKKTPKMEKNAFRLELLGLGMAFHSVECKQASSLTNFLDAIVNRCNCKLYIGNYNFAFRYRYL